MPVAAPLALPDADREVLRSWVRSPLMPSGLVMRARIVLLAAEGVPNAVIARRLGLSRQTVVTWRGRYRAGGLDGLEDRPRSGRPGTVDEAEVMVRTLEGPPERLGVTHWSSRLLAAELGISNVAVAKVWRKWKIQPWRSETFKFSTDPELEAKVRDVVGLYLAPPAKAVVVCVDEKSQIQALDRTAPMLPVRPGLAEIFFGIITRQAIRRGTFTSVPDLTDAIGRHIDAYNQRCQPFT